MSNDEESSTTSQTAAAQAKKAEAGRSSVQNTAGSQNKYQPAKRFTLSPEAALSILPKLPDLPLDQLKSVWDNAVHILASKKQSNLHAAANIILDDIAFEWKRRYGAPIHADDFFKWPSTEAIGGTGYP